MKTRYSVSSRGKSKGYLAAFAEIKIRFYIAIKKMGIPFYFADAYSA